MSRKVPDIPVSMHITRRQLAALRETLEMEAERTIDNEGFLGCDLDEKENLAYRCDLLTVLLKLPAVPFKMPEATNAID